MNSKQLKTWFSSGEFSDVINVIVCQGGKKCAEFHRDEEIRRNQYSASKSFTSAAVGIAIKEGLFSLEDHVTDFFPEELPKEPSENLLKLTVRDLLTMCIGQNQSYLMGGTRLWVEESDWVKFVLRQPFAYRPGERFLYSNAGPYLAGILVQKKAGCSLVDYLMPRLFEPLGILRPAWEVDPMGRTFGAGGLFLCVSDMAKFGQLYLNGGVWNNKRILTEEWVRETAEKQADNGKYGYGYLFWCGPYGSFLASGKYGQYSIIFGDKNAVVAINSESRRADHILHYVFETIYPEL